MTPQQIFILTCSIVLVALLISLFYWIRINGLSKGTARKAAICYVICFGLYSVGQAMVILQSLKVITGWFDIPSYLYALAALIFAVGSHFQYRSVAVPRK